MGGKHKKCLNDECDLIASFGFNKTLGTKYCSKHKEDGMINLLCKLCYCGRARPTYNFSGLSANYCSICKTDGMVNVNDKGCACGLVKATFNYEGLKAKYCSKCKLNGMVDVTHQKCVCKKSSASFNYEGLKAQYCSKCKLDGMVDVRRKKCFCGRANASFNFEGLKPTHCFKCKLDGMISLRKHNCIKCKKYSASFNFVGEKPKYCSNCKEDAMVNVKSNCKSSFCTSYGNKNYDFYCIHCFSNLFPNDPRSKNVRFKTKEITIRDFLNENFEEFIHDTPLWTGNCDCSHRRRIDFRKLVGNTLLCIEVDEFQHKRYDKDYEEIRYDDLYMAFSGKYIFIRFNPDEYVDKYGNRKNPKLIDRLDTLGNEICYQMNRIEDENNKELLEIVYLFYDEK